MTSQATIKKIILSNSSPVLGRRKVFNLVPFLVASVKSQDDMLFGFKKKVLF